MKNKILSLVLVISMLASLFVAMPVSADADGPTITVSGTTVDQGEGTETVEVPIAIDGNTGVLGLQLKVKYAEGLTLTNVAKGDALTGLSFTPSGDLTADPITLMWDGESDVDTSNGVIATLIFTVPKDTVKDYAIEITKSIVLDENMGDVEVTIVDGKISVVKGEPDPEPHVHEWDAGVITVSPTCTEEGVKTYTCSICGETKTEVIPAEGHKDENNDHYCDYCGDMLSDCADDDNDHNCNVCGTQLSECADADNDHNCDICGTPLSECADDDNDHNCDVCGTPLSECADADNDHNCDVCGTQVSECADTNNDHNCDICGTKLSECSWDEGVVTTPETCTVNGIKTYTCSICGKTKTEAIPAIGHEHGDWVEDGDVHKKTCVRGDDVITEAHTWDNGVVTIKPTATTEGVKTYTCTVCSATKTETIKKLDGTIIIVSDVTIAQGEGTQTVEVPIVLTENAGILGMTLQVKYDEGLTLTNVKKGDALSSLAFTKPGNLSANPVNILWDGESNEDTSNGTIAVLTFTVPTDTVKDFAIEITKAIVIDGNMDDVEVAIVDGKISVSEIHTHSYGDWVANGDNHKKTCSCDDVVLEPHAWNDGVVTTQPAYPQKGEKTYTCTVCGQKKTEVMEWVYNPGDPTDDGMIDTRDIISIRRHIAGGYNVVINLAGADADKDGMIDSRDIILIRRYLAGGYGIVLK